jgi:hypothetical protein
MSPKKSKYSRAQARARIRRTKRRSGSMGWTVATLGVVAVGVLMIVLFRGEGSSDAQPRVNEDHWHAYLGVNVCGSWLPPAPGFDSPNGIHSHEDSLIHIHPFASAAAGDNATVARFIEDNEGADWELSADSMKLWDGVEYRNGDTCESGEFEGEKGRIVWSVGHYGEEWTGRPRSGDPADFAPRNADIVAIAFLPESEQTVPEPPDAEPALENIEDLGGASAVSTTVPPSTTPPTTTPRLPGSTTPSSAPPPPSP